MENLLRHEPPTSLINLYAKISKNLPITLAYAHICLVCSCTRTVKQTNKQTDRQSIWIEKNLCTFLFELFVNLVENSQSRKALEFQTCCVPYIPCKPWAKFSKSQYILQIQHFLKIILIILISKSIWKMHTKLERHPTKKSVLTLFTLREIFQNPQPNEN